MNTLRVLNVGQCGFDNGTISRYLRDHFHALTVSVDTLEESLEILKGSTFQLVLVNRLLDWDGTPGLEVIRKIKAAPNLAHMPIMLVSNYEDAQAAAIAEGAFPGFGKADIGSRKAKEALSIVFDMLAKV
jgi:CheY-like chemotaxis protein